MDSDPGPFQHFPWQTVFRCGFQAVSGALALGAGGGRSSSGGGAVFVIYPLEVKHGESMFARLFGKI